MSQTTQTDPFEQTIRKSGQGYLIDWHQPQDQALPNLRRIIADTDASGRQRLGEDWEALTPESIAAGFDENPQKVTAFLQVIGTVRTPAILVMVWRILDGANIAQLSVDYQSELHFRMRVTLESSFGGEEIYESNDIDDAVILRHIGVMKMNDRPVFDGFYPLKLE